MEALDFLRGNPDLRVSFSYLRTRYGVSEADLRVPGIRVGVINYCPVGKGRIGGSVPEHLYPYLTTLECDLCEEVHPIAECPNELAYQAEAVT